MSLFTGTEEFKAAVPEIHRHFDWEKELKPLTEQAELLYLQPYLGEEFLAELTTQVEAQTLSTENATLIAKLRPALGYYTFHDMLTSMAAHMTQMGLQVSNASDGSSQPAAHYLRNDMREHAANRADTFLDLALTHMEQKVSASPGGFATWYNSSIYSEFFELFIWLSSQFTRWVKGLKSTRALYAIRHNLRWVQERDLQPLLGEELYADLLLKIRERHTTALTEEYQALINKIQPYLALQSVVEAMPEHRVEMSHGGIYFRTYDGPVAQARQQASDTAVRHVLTQLTAKAQGAMATLKQFLIDQADDYSLYTAPDLLNGESVNQPTIINGKGSLFL